MNINSQILDLINKRLIKGERKYGHENVINDGRDFIREALEESLDCAVYLTARLVEIQNKKEKQMGRAINQEKISADHGRRLKLLEVEIKVISDALEELLQKGTSVHHVDLTEVKPDEEFRAPVTVKKKRRKALEKRIKATT